VTSQRSSSRPYLTVRAKYFFPRRPFFGFGCCGAFSLSTCLHTYTHTRQHSFNVECVGEFLFPHSKHNRKTAQIRKATIPKAPSVVWAFSDPHPHKENKKTFDLLLKQQTFRLGKQRIPQVKINISNNELHVERFLGFSHEG
jgi:hypothetical protein